MNYDGKVRNHGEVARSNKKPILAWLISFSSRKLGSHSKNGDNEIPWLKKKSYWYGGGEINSN
jgi:hypothetical protein